MVLRDLLENLRTTGNHSVIGGTKGVVRSSRSLHKKGGRNEGEKKDEHFSLVVTQNKPFDHLPKK